MAKKKEEKSKKDENDTISLSLDKDNQFMVTTIIERGKYESRSKLFRELILEKYTEIMKNE